MADEQIELTEDDFNWNRELNMPQSAVDSIDPDNIPRIKQLSVLTRAGKATQEDLAEYLRLMNV